MRSSNTPFISLIRTLGLFVCCCCCCFFGNRMSNVYEVRKQKDVDLNHFFPLYLQQCQAGIACSRSSKYLQTR